MRTRLLSIITCLSSSSALILTEDGKIYVCSGKNLYAFESNGTISWTINLGYTCHAGMAPVHGGRGKTEMEGKISRTIDEYTYVSAMQPKTLIFTLLVPAIGTIYWSESSLGEFSSLLSESDLCQFVVDEGILLAFLGAQIRSLHPAACKQVPSISSSTQRSLQLKKKVFDRTITELKQKAAEEVVANEVAEKFGEMVREREGVERKLSTTYSLGRDRAGSLSKSLLPLYDGKARSYSFQGVMKESVTVFHTLSDTTSGESSSEKETGSEFHDEESAAKAKAPMEAKSSSDEGSFGRDYGRSPLEITASSSRGLPIHFQTKEQEAGEVTIMHDEEEIESTRSTGSRLRLKRRNALSSPN
ncbi:protein GAMETE EXPRESSED 3-like [Carya illinoinensis]|uniref:protein GAMETE EXPRESSED 3-like n=1 Tax=Carya illinoinensis TaxID=32201 RepID=UPI001C722943|nr:protein GAMETE EXPRESSED 3-like [Carya illinoinensis]